MTNLMSPAVVAELRAQPPQVRSRKIEGHTYTRCDKCDRWRPVVVRWSDESGTHNECMFCVE